MKLNKLGIIMLTMLLWGSALGTVSAHEDDVNTEIKLGNFLEVSLPDYTHKSPDCTYTWSWTYDVEHLNKYMDKDGNIAFKTLEKGRTIMLAQMNEHNTKTGRDRVVKTVSYTITIK